MMSSEQVKTRLIGLITEGESLNPHDLEAFYRWMEASYEALEFNSLRQEMFDEYCRSCCDSSSMRLYKGVWMLELALKGDASDHYYPMYSQA